ncbi:hypothetical protein [Marinimicrobium sp. C2-29]|uniref:hypothetical protein n=1 Tax=Marinimicrobium sp. C2-29 TaxID=3139825 RepID=UPI00313A3218
MRSPIFPLRGLLFGALCALALAANAQFVDHFEGDSIDEQWGSFTGDGDASLEFIPRGGFARMEMDASDDRHNVWWSIIKRNVAGDLDLEKLQDPDYELRVEARIRVSHAPKRVNFMINTQRTTDFHQHLREYDIPDSDGWHVISMTTRDLDVAPGDALNVQLSATDWGPDQYHLDVDYYRADVVLASEADPDRGEPLVYHPPVPALDTFDHRRSVDQDALLNRDFPEVNFDGWSTRDGDRRVRVLTVSARQWPILRWDFDELQNESGRAGEADGAGVLELTTHSVFAGGDYVGAHGEDLGVEFDKIRVFEVFGGPADWQQSSITFERFAQGKPLAELFNSQMTFDVAPARQKGGKTRITLPRPVMQRLLNGTTRGLLIRPLGALEASFYDSEEGAARAPTLYFNFNTR